MTVFVRTTGGLLQLKKKQVSRADLERIAEVAAKLKAAGVNLDMRHISVQKPKPQPRKKQSMRVEHTNAELVDLQAALPVVFR